MRVVIVVWMTAVSSTVLDNFNSGTLHLFTFTICLNLTVASLDSFLGFVNHTSTAIVYLGHSDTSFSGRKLIVP